jgi:hypothetical protein
VLEVIDDYGITQSGRRCNTWAAVPLMARDRWITKRLFRSRRLASVPELARLTFVGLWTLANNWGILPDDTEAISADLYPYDDDVTAEVVDAELAALAAAGLIRRFGVNGHRLIRIPVWCIWRYFGGFRALRS